MRRRVIPMVAALLLAAAARSPAAPPPATTQSIAPELQTALDQLADDDPQVRQAAQDRLVRFGKEANGPLQSLIASSQDIEQRNGAEAALARIAEDASIGTTIVSLKVTNASQTDVVKALATASGMAVRLEDRGNQSSRKRVNLTLDHEPFWVAVKKVCAAAELSISNNYNENRDELVLQRGNNADWSGRPFIIDGPFMVMADTIAMNSSVSLTTPISTNKGESITLQCLAEPKLKIAMRSYNARLTEATDDTGASLMPPSTADNDMSDSPDQHNIWNMSSPLALPSDAATKIVHLRGQMPVTVVTRSETIQVDNILQAKNVTKHAGGNTLTVKETTTEGDQIVVSVLLQVPPNQNNVGYQLAQGIRLTDADGNVISNGVNVNGGGSFTRLEYKLAFNMSEKKAGPPARLIMPVPLETKPLSCNFEFTNLPLP